MDATASSTLKVDGALELQELIAWATAVAKHAQPSAVVQPLTKVEYKGSQRDPVEIATLTGLKVDWAIVT